METHKPPRFFLERVVELLGHGHPGDGAAEFGVHGGMLERTGAESLAGRTYGIKFSGGGFGTILRENRRDGEQRKGGGEQKAASVHGIGGGFRTDLPGSNARRWIFLDCGRYSATILREPTDLMASGRWRSMPGNVLLPDEGAGERAGGRTGCRWFEIE